MRIKLKVGQIYTINSRHITSRDKYRITDPGSPGIYSRCIDIRTGYYYDFAYIGNDGMIDAGVWELTKPDKIIPDIPLDPMLPILEAGHLQDRQRKKYRFRKNAS